MNIVDEYILTNKAMALFPAYKIDYDTVVIKEDGIVPVKKKALNIIDDSCIKLSWTTFEGRRESVLKNTTYKRKVPLPICATRNIYLFPTHGFYTNHAHFISPLHITNVEDTDEKGIAKITFINGLQYDIPVSKHIINSQIKRMAECLKIKLDLS